jgi:hypothetical protein
LRFRRNLRWRPQVNNIAEIEHSKSSLMKTNLLCGAIVLLAGSLVGADSASDVKTAAKKLTEKGYSWKTTSESAGSTRGSGRAPGPTEGKIDKDGTTQLSMTRGENTIEAVLKGDKGAIKTDEGWKSLTEAAEADGGGGQGNRVRFTARMLQNFKAPAVEAEEMAGKVKDLKKDGEVYTATLSADEVKALMTRGFRPPGGDGPEVADAKGSVKFWIKEGVLSKFESNIRGKMTFNNNDVDINRTTTVEIKDVGTTKVNVPEDAKKKLS